MDFDAPGNCCLYDTTMEAVDFQDDIPSIAINYSNNHYVLVFVLTSMRDANKKCHYPELVGESLRLELSFTFPLEHITKLNMLGQRMPPVAVDKIAVLGKSFQIGECFSAANNQSYLATQVSVPLFIAL